MGNATRKLQTSLPTKIIRVSIAQAFADIKELQLATIGYTLQLTSLFLFNSCDNETPATISGGGRIKFDISISPALKPGEIFQVILSTGGQIQAVTEGYSGEITPEYAVTKGQNFTALLMVNNPLFPEPVSCKTVTIDAVLNGSVIDTKVFEMGYKQYPLNIEYCKDGYSKSVNYIIP